ncbi:3-dehydroquinate synthase [Desulfurella amilsii]|uniref:3-dehydroquinate synthase n=1 Tax=Desulfurella amilsii TaxID=1562698 RepID=A0A1X4XXN6_9BACT|nr:3-dehydroquinate synthase [Desulfurella amilsii]OSS42296.1 3-dehydroquinate synthase [Desulfurella amilsii]
MSQIISVELAQSYNISISYNDLSNLSNFLKNSNFVNRLFIISDANVCRLHLQTLLHYIEKANFSYSIYCFEPGEQSKSKEVLFDIYDFLIENKADRKTPLIAFGGGVVGDVASFAASTFMRGMPLIHVPTTVVSQTDSSIGGKTAINHAKGKNLIGTFYQPNAVFIDTKFLDTLSDEEFFDAFSEIIKYGIIMDRQLFSFIEEHSSDILKRDHKAIQKLIYDCAKDKSLIVQKDEKEASLRAILNFGHTLGHAIEAYFEYKKYTHPQAVSIGEVFATRLSHKLGLIDEKTFKIIKDLLEKFHLPTKIDNINPTLLIEIMKHDKKAKGGVLEFILTKSIGEVIIANDINNSLLIETIRELQ